MTGTSNFYTAVIVKDRRFYSRERIADPLLLEPVTRGAVQQIIAAAGLRGIDLRVFETYRSTDRQRDLYAEGKTHLPTVGCHHFGVACDLVVYQQGQPTWNVDYSFMGPLAAQQGLVWGGPGSNNLDIGDLDHVQRCAIKDQPWLFGGQWYPNEFYRIDGNYHDGPQKLPDWEDP